MLNSAPNSANALNLRGHEGALDWCWRPDTQILQVHDYVLCGRSQEARESLVRQPQTASVLDVGDLKASDLHILCAHRFGRGSERSRS